MKQKAKYTSLRQYVITVENQLYSTSKELKQAKNDLEATLIIIKSLQQSDSLQRAINSKAIDFVENLEEQLKEAKALNKTLAKGLQFKRIRLSKLIKRLRSGISSRCLVATTLMLAHICTLKHKKF